MSITKPATEKELEKATVLTNLLNCIPDSKSAPDDAKIWVQYKRNNTKDSIKYTFTITNLFTPEKEYEDKHYTITGKVIDISKYTGDDHNSRMISYLKRVNPVEDNLKLTDDEQHIIKYNQSLNMDGEKKHIKSLYRNTFYHLFYNNKLTSIENIKGLLSHPETQVIIIDENLQRNVTKIVRGSMTMIIFPNDIPINNSHEKPVTRNSLKIIRDSETTKGLKVFQKNAKKYPAIAKGFGAYKEEINEALNMSSLYDSITTISSELTNQYGNDMVKSNVVEEIEAGLKHLLELFGNLKVSSQTEKASLESKDSENSKKRLKVDIKQEIDD